LPHRELRRERQRNDFVLTTVLVVLLGGAVVLLGAALINQAIANQRARNEFLTAQNAELDREISEVAKLRQEIAALRARQKAVQDLQSDRTLPVHLFSELARLTPEHLMLRQIRQEGDRLTMTGLAQSNERIAEFLHNLSERSPWLERPELSEIKDSTLGGGGAHGEARRGYEFSLNATIRKAGPAKSGGEGPGQSGVAPASAAPQPAAVGPKLSN